MYVEIAVFVVVSIFVAGIAKGVWEYYKDKKDTEQGNFLLKEG